MSDAGAELLADVLLAGDQDGAAYAAQRLRMLLAEWKDRNGNDWDRARGAARALMAMASVVADRLPSPRTLAKLGTGTHAHGMLSLLHAAPRLTGTEVAEQLAVGATQVSRTGKRLLAEGCVTKVKVAQTTLWEITPRGEEVLALLDDLSASHAPERDAAAVPIEAEEVAMAMPLAVGGVIAGGHEIAGWSTVNVPVGPEITLEKQESGLFQVVARPVDVTALSEELTVIGVKGVGPGLVGTDAVPHGPAPLTHSAPDFVDAHMYPLLSGHGHTRHADVASAWEATAGHKLRPVDRSRLWFLGLWLERFPQVIERLGLWGSLGTFASGAPRFYIPDPQGSPAEVRGTLDTVLEQFDLSLRAVWPAGSPPVWDGYAIVPGPDDRKGLVLFEAKSEFEELRDALPALRNVERRKDLYTAINTTARTVTQEQRRWHATPYADVAARLTMLRLLRDHGVETWLYNVYFVDPTGSHQQLPASAEDWEQQLTLARGSLKIRSEHAYTNYVRDEYFVVPPAALVADVVVGGNDNK